MNATTKRLQAHAAHAQACCYEVEAQAYWQAYCTLSDRKAGYKAGELYVQAKDRADALRLASRALWLQAHTLSTLEAQSCES